MGCACTVWTLPSRSARLAAASLDGVLAVAGRMTRIVLFFPLLPTAILIAQAVLLTQRGQTLSKMMVGISHCVRR
ncbi:MAG: hypothetical protein VX733_05805 [Candidatus Latescibacterota bacterium]|nr:hypothetical protein [Candidatus Latescibacterota bacterium]